MSRREIADKLRRWDAKRESYTYFVRLALAQAIMPHELRFHTLKLWYVIQQAKLRELEALATAMQDEAEWQMRTRQAQRELDEDRVVVPIDYLQRFL